jgi:hypothetical protein
MPGKPVVRCLAKHNSPEAKKAQMRMQKACRRRFSWLKGQKIMIPCNVWTSNYFSNPSVVFV